MEAGWVRKVEFCSSDNTVKCSCKKFEFTGVLCSHALRVLRNKNVVELPPQYFLTRWSRDAKPDVVVDNSGTILVANTDPPMSERYSELSQMAQVVVTMGAVDEKQTQIARLGLKKVIDQLGASQKSIEDNSPTLSAIDGENPSSVTEQTVLDHPSEDITIQAPPRKKAKGQQPGRIKGFYDSMKKRGKGRSQQKKTAAGNKGKDGVTETVKRKRKPRQRKGKIPENGGIVAQSMELDNSIQNPYPNNEQLQQIPITYPTIEGSASFGLDKEDQHLHYGSYNVPSTLQNFISDNINSSSNPMISMPDPNIEGYEVLSSGFLELLQRVDKPNIYSQEVVDNVSQRAANYGQSTTPSTSKGATRHINF